MSKKVKGKGGKTGSKGPGVEEKEKLSEVDRAFYELTIQDVRKKIITLRTHIQNLQKSNVDTIEEIRALTEDQTDEVGELERNVNEIYGNIVQLRSDNAVLTDEFNSEKLKAEEQISDLEVKYKAMHDQLSAQIKSLNGKLNACEEFSLNRDLWMLKFGDRADELADKEKATNEFFKELGTKTQYENELLKDELLGKLTLAGEEFTGAGSKNKSDFNMRLIRENIALQKNIELLINSNNEMDMRIEEELQLYQSHKADIPKIEKKNSQLIMESQENLYLIKKLTDLVKLLKKEYISSLSYREQNISFKEFQMCARFRQMKLKMAAIAVGHQVNAMNHEINLYDFLIEQYKLETKKIEEHLENIRCTIERSISIRETSSSSSESIKEKVKVHWLERNSLLSVLVDIFSHHFDVLDPGHRASLATIDRYDKLTHFNDFFKKVPPSLSSFMDVCAAYIESEEESIQTPGNVKKPVKIGTGREVLEYETYTPGERPVGRNYLFDVETGSSLYFSPSIEGVDRQQVEEQADAEGEEEGSSERSTSVALDSDSEAKKEPTLVSKAPGDTVPIKLPPGTIVDVVSEEENEGEPLQEEYIEEDEEYDINLFY